MGLGRQFVWAWLIVAVSAAQLRATIEAPKTLPEILREVTLVGMMRIVHVEPGVRGTDKYPVVRACVEEVFKGEQTTNILRIFWWYNEAPKANELYYAFLKEQTNGVYCFASPWWSGYKVTDQPPRINAGRPVYHSDCYWVLTGTAYRIPYKPKRQVEKWPVEHLVKAGDSLVKLSEEYYGTTTRWQRIWEANPSLKEEPHQLQIGRKLVIPNISDYE